MELFYRRSGAGHPLIILHGLYGSSDNWYTLGRTLSEHYDVFLIDQRNHGYSPHHPTHDYPSMANDLADFFEKHHLDQAHVIGHSMGGKAALAFGFQHPRLVSKMIVVDISPCGYDQASWIEAGNHERIIRSLLAIKPENLKNREEADLLLQKYIEPVAVRQFLLKNLKRNREGKFYWSLNLMALANHLDDILEGVIDCNTTGNESGLPQFPLLFIKGEYSKYLRQSDLESIKRLLPWSVVTEISGSGHWVQAEQPADFLAAVQNFLN